MDLRTSTQGLYSLSGKTSCHQISQILEVLRLCYNYRIALKFGRYLGSGAVNVLVKFQSDWKSLNPISWLRDFARSCGKTLVRLVNRGRDRPVHRRVRTFLKSQTNSWTPRTQHYPAGTWCNNNGIVTLKRRRFGVIMSLLLRYVSAG